MKNKKRNYVVIALIVLLLALAIGYAAFSDTLTISGSANANGKFDMIFESATIDEDTAIGIDVEGSETALYSNGNELYVKVKDLAYPGAGTNITAVVKNEGTAPAILNDMEFTGCDDDDIEITFPQGLNSKEVIQPGATTTITFSVKWSTASVEPLEKSVQFTAKLNYTQYVDGLTNTTENN